MPPDATKYKLSEHRLKPTSNSAWCGHGWGDRAGYKAAAAGAQSTTVWSAALNRVDSHCAERLRGERGAGESPPLCSLLLTGQVNLVLRDRLIRPGDSLFTRAAQEASNRKVLLLLCLPEWLEKKQKAQSIKCITAWFFFFLRIKCKL